MYSGVKAFLSSCKARACRRCLVESLNDMSKSLPSMALSESNTPTNCILGVIFAPNEEVEETVLLQVSYVEFDKALNTSPDLAPYSVCLEFLQSFSKLS